ncbi:DNA polymerase III subunit alpha [Halocola ammonii]
MLTNTHTYYSLRFGTMAPKALMEQLRQFGYSCFALTDVNNTSACLDMVRLAKKFDIRPVLGIDFRNGATQKYVGLAKNNRGFENLNRHLSKHLHAEESFESRAPQMSDVFFIYPFAAFQKKPFELRENEFIGVRPQDLQQLRLSPLRNNPEKLVALPTATFRNKKDFNTHRLLRAIDCNTLLSKLSPEQQSPETDRLRPADELREIYDEAPYLLKNAEKLLDQCSIDFEVGNEVVPKNQKAYTGNTELDFRLMKKLAYDGLRYRYPKIGERVIKRLEKELEVIREKEFVSYFLINWKILKYARSKGYFYVGRGSGANSIVAYLLRITDVDPIELDLYFERFINLYRKNPPDFDIDFSWTDREDITRFIFERFPNTALLATYNTFRFKAVVRELGKVFGLPKHEIDKLSQGQINYQRADQINQLVLRYSEYIQGFPNHLSIHAGGILISEKPIEYYSATFMPPKGYRTVQFDMVAAEDVGLYKFDILSQRGLGKIRDTIDIVKYNQPEKFDFDIHDIKRFKRDERIKDMLRNALAIGCFYVESPAMRMLLKKLQVDDYLGLVAASSVIRPGVAKSGMMREYILRYRFPEKRKDAHPVMRKLMPETYGVMVYQEDVIKVAHYFAGLSLGEADVLRRGMSGKYRGREEFEKARQKFLENCRQKGYPEKLTAEVWRQVESFAGYAFAKGHSASYAVESYQSLFLKAYFPLEYMVATVNNFGGFYRTELYVHEARMNGGEIMPPCVNHSTAEAVIRRKKIYLGFGLVKELEVKTIAAIVRQRQTEGPFSTIEEFVKRVQVSLDQLVLLVRIGGFKFTGKSKKELLWKAHFLLGNTRKSRPEKLLFDADTKSYELPDLQADAFEDAFDEIELIGFPLCNPFSLIDWEKVEGRDTVTAGELPKLKDKIVTAEGYLVTVKETRTSNGQRMMFGTFIDCNGEWIDSVHFPQVAAEFRFRGRGVYRITGKVMEEFDCINLEVTHMEKLPMMEDPRYADSRTASKITREQKWNKREKDVTKPGQRDHRPNSFLEVQKGLREEE